MHEHHHHGAHQGHGHGVPDSRRILTTAVVITLGFALVEAVAGWWAGSLALMSDAGHMLTDSTALGLAAVAAWLARRPPSHRHSFGLGRMETLTALFNALFMVALVSVISAVAVQRLLEPAPVQGGVVAWIAFLGLLVNLIVAWLLMGGRRNANVRGALLHVFGDLLGSIAALVSGVVILHTGWTPIDPILSVFVALLILISAMRLLGETLHTLLEGVPRHLDLQDVGQTMAASEGVVSVHDLHIWSLSGEKTALSAHIVLRRIEDWEPVLQDLQRLLAERFGVEHVTLQPEALEVVVPLRTGSAYRAGEPA